MASIGLERVHTIDTVRGVAVMGILLMNIVAFAMPEAAYMNPRAYGGSEGMDLWVYLFNFVLFDGKMRGLFSFLFGASMLLVIERAEAKGESPAAVHYRRMVVLLLFGLAHLWLIWWGDILHIYALVGMAAFLFRKAPVKRLVSVGIALVVLQFLMMAAMPFALLMMQNPPAGANAAELAEGLKGFENAMGIPSAEHLAEDLAVHRGGYAELVASRFDKLSLAPVTNVLLFGAETLGYMLFGMACLKSGLLTGAWSPARYRKGLLIGFGIGLPAYVALAAYLLARDFSLMSVVVGVMWLPTLVRPLMILGWACLIVLLARPGGALTSRFAATGRMAFTNYLVTSLVCSTFFYGYGLGLYGQLGRAEIYLVVFAVWAAMLLWSRPWLARFRYGPFEWLWRTLSRGSLQPMRGAAAA